MANMKFRKYQALGVLVALGLILSLAKITPTRAQAITVIDFEGIPEGSIVSQVYMGYGISGEPVEGEVNVFGYNPAFGLGVNAAMIFDATCQPGGAPINCSGQDRDLFNPSFGNTLIISEDLDSTDPDDADMVGAVFVFDFSHWGSGLVNIDSFEVQDVEEEETENAIVEFYVGGLEGTLVATVDIPETGNGLAVTVPLNVSGVDTMRIDLQGSGEINNIYFEQSPPTAVDLLYFRVTNITERKAQLEWATAAEINNYGFNLYRSPSSNISIAEKIHFEPAAGGLGGNTYSYTDTIPGVGTWWYWLSDIDTNGLETFHYPVQVTIEPAAPLSESNWIFLPITLSSR